MYAQEEEIVFDVKNAAQNLCFKASVDQLKLNATSLKMPVDVAIDTSNHSLFNNEFQYLSAERLGPQSFYKRDTYSVESRKQLSNKKGHGENIAHFLDYYGNKIQVQDSLKHPSCKDSSLRAQVDAWLSEITRQSFVNIKDLGDSFQILFRFSEDGSEIFKAENVGFGLSYSLPIVAALLAAETDSLILIENPEAHLHPKGQSKLAQLMALAAQAGVQIIAETHSDHVVNGVLVATKRFKTENIGISNENISIYYIDKIAEEQGHEAAHATFIPVSEDGRIRNAPNGFFDQSAADRRYLMGF